MAGSVLVTYATRSGWTREVAEAVAATLREHHLEVNIQPMKAVSSLAGYRAVVLGAPLFMFRWHKDARCFLSWHRQALQECSVAVFALGPFHDVEEEWEGMRGQLEKALAKFPWFKPVDIGPPVASKIPTGLRPWHLLRKSAFILRAACPQTPCKDGIHPRSYERGPLSYFDRQELAVRNPIWQNVSSTT
jgi:flavodoxin